MRKTIRETAGFERLYIEAHISSVVAIGVEYGLDIELSRHKTRTDIRLKQYYTSGTFTMAAVDISFKHTYDNETVEIEYVMFDAEEEKYVRSEKRTYPEYNGDALDWIINLVWNTEGAP